jgi:hypothetical protein
MKSTLGWALLAFFICIAGTGFGQVDKHWPTYSVSKYVDTTNLNAKKLFADKKKAALLQNNIAEFYLYKNGRPVVPTGKIKTAFFPSSCLCFKFDDTLMLNSGLGKQAGVGVGIKIYKDRFGGSFHANARNALVYKEHQTDSTYINDIVAEPVLQSLRLLRKPGFSSNEIIIGEYNAVYRKFYQKRTNAKDQPVTYRVRLIFKCKVTGMDGLKDLIQLNNSTSSK